MKTVAIILAGGEGDRFGAEIPKQFISLNGKPIIQWTINCFKTHPEIDQIVVVVNKNWMSEVKKICPEAIIASGGKTRQESSKNGLIACPSDTKYVLIHDAVRPLIDHSIISRCLKMLHEGKKAVLTIIPSTDTIVRARKSLISQMEDREVIKRAQTPQCFDYETILQAHRQTTIKNSTDDGRLVMEMEVPLYVVAGSERNIKITTQADIYTAERLMQLSEPKSMETVDLTGKIAIVFGGTSGIGKSAAEQLKKCGAKVYPVGRKECDIRDPEAINNFFLKVGKFDILVNSAGILVPKKVMDLDDKIIDDTFASNILGVIHTCRLAARFMPKGGHIVNVGSSSAYRGRAGYSVYSATKAALVNFSQALAAEYEEYGIKVNVVSPPRTRTRMYLQINPNVDPAELFDPDEAGRVITYYCTGEETGQVIDLKIGNIVRSDPVEAKWGSKK
ncbi:MAG: 2-C-methyl-D-erythritol 4-phosphate cytidylyltransferase [Candidatus Hermodarchaeota archaeon]